MGSMAIAQTGPARKTAAILGLAAFYSVFAGGFALAFSSMWPLLAFWGLTLNRLLRVLLGGGFSSEEKELMKREWATSSALYLFLTLSTLIIPLPSFGITTEVIAAQNLPGSGVWIEQPQRVIALGFLYFSSLAAMSLLTVKWVPVPSSRSATFG